MRILSQFEKIVVVSTGKSWRVDGLLEAADLTGLDLEILEQPDWSNHDVDVFRKATEKASKPNLGPGQARCWLGHIHALHEVIKERWSTALIMEDDADWDISIKQQLAMIAPLIRKVTNSTAALDLEMPYGDA